MAEQSHHPPWLVAPWLPRRGLAVIGAPAKCAKTVFALNMAYSLAGGLEFLGRRVPPMRVLYVDREVGEYAIRERLRSIHRASQEYDATQHLAVQCRSRYAISLDAGTAGLANLRSLVADFRPAVLMLDPLRDCFAGDENDSAAMTKVFQALFEIEDEFECAAVVVHHCGKPGREFPYDPADPYAMRGSSRIFDVGDSYLMLKKRGDYGLQVFFTLRHSVHRPMTCAWAQDDYKLRFEEQSHGQAN